MTQPDRANLWIIVFVALDLGVFATGLVTRVDRQREVNLRAQIGAPSAQRGSTWMRMQSGGGWPTVWAQSSEPDRLLDVEASQRAAWFGRWHLADRVGVMNNMVSIRSRQMAWFWAATRRVTEGMSGRERERYWRSIQDWMAVDGIMYSSSDGVRIRTDGRTALVVDRKLTNRVAGQPIRAYRRWSTETGEPSLERMERLLRELSQNQGGAVPMVQGPLAVDQSTAALPLSRAVIKMIESAPERLECTSTSSQATLLVRPVFQDGNWLAEYAPAGTDDYRSARVRAVDYLLQGVTLPAGSWRIRFCYSPWWLPWSLAIAAVAWVGLLIAAASSTHLPMQKRLNTRSRISSV